MKIDEWTSEDVHTSGGGEFLPSLSLGILRLNFYGKNDDLY